MTTLTVVDDRPDETRAEAIARRLRGELGQLNLSVSEVARRTGLSQPALSRRMTGQLPFDVEELDLICQTLGISFDYIASGIRAIREVPPPNPPPASSHIRRRGADKKVRRVPGRGGTDKPVGSEFCPATAA